MGDKVRKVPHIRFKGFTDDWEQRKLGDVAIRVTRKNKDLESTLPLTISAQDGLIDQNEFFNKTIASRDVSGYYLVKNGEFAYNKSYSNGYPWGAVKRLDRYEMGVLSTLYIVFKTTDVDCDFLSKYYDGDNWHKEVSKHAAEGARNHGLLNIAAADFFETELTIPASKSEQQQIGSFFKQIDNIITLHQRKLDLLKVTKKSMLQKMFPKDGESVPEIRFAGFTDDWQQSGLGKMGNTFTGLSGKTKEDFGHGDAKFVTYINVFGNVISDPTGVESVEIDSKQNQVKYGDVFFTTSSETPEEVGMASVWLQNTENVYLNSFCFGYRPTVDFDLYYLAFMLRSPEIRKSFMLLAQGISRYNISKTKVMEMKVPVPQLNEQRKIGNFFKTIDSLISNHQYELDLLKDFKKSMLQQMFI